jgi:MarR family transcriptional regulator, lower aerobic nicotinate degradation pathway regulator
VDAGADPIGAGLGFLLARAGGRAIRAVNRALQPFGLRSRHYTVLLVAAESGGCSQRDLGVTLDVDPSVVVSLVDDLERDGLVRRESRPPDRRTRLITATPAGLALLERLRVLSREADEELTSRLDDGERATLLALLRRVGP